MRAGARPAARRARAAAVRARRSAAPAAGCCGRRASGSPTARSTTIRPVHRGRGRRTRSSRPLERARAEPRSPRERSPTASTLALTLDGGRARAAAGRLPDGPRASCSSSTAEGDAAAPGARLGPPLGRAPRRPRRAPRHLARPGRAARPARRRPRATPAPTARPRCSPTAASRRATARRCRGCCPAAATRSGSRPTPTARASTWPASGCRCPRARRPARCACTLLVRADAGRPAARVLPLTGFPALLPEWGYGFWKSRDVYEHQDDVLEDFDGFREHRIPLDAIVLDSPWATQYNTWEFNPHQFPDAARDDRDAARRRRAHRGVGRRRGSTSTRATARSRRDAESERLHREPAPNYAPGAAAGHFVRERRRRAVRGAVVDGHRLAGRLHHRPRPRRGGASRPSGVLDARGRGDQGRRRRGLLHPRRRRGSPTARTGAEAAWALGGLVPAARCSGRSTRSTRAAACCSAAAAGPASRRPGVTWGGDQASDFWSLRVLVVATLSAACSGFSNWSHDVGGYLGHRLVERCPPELLAALAAVRLLHAADAGARRGCAQEPWTLRRAGARALPRLRAAARAARAVRPRGGGHARRARGLPIIRPLCLVDPRDAARLVDRRRVRLRAGAVGRAGARRRRARARGRAAARASGSRRGRARACAAAARSWRRRRSSGSRCGCGAGSIVVTYPAEHVAARARGRAGGRAAAGGDAVGRARGSATRGAAGRRHADRVAAGRWSVRAAGAREVEAPAGRRVSARGLIDELGLHVRQK